ncbi:MAG: squalene/phytoene synthase family protein, partial [Chthoniobacterales bacterium]
MSMPRELQLREISEDILRSVSRSFYLSIRWLPAALREPIGLAYLLARATDTIADTSEISVATRKSQLEVLAEAIQGKRSPDQTVDLASTVAPLQSNSSERALIEAVPRCLRWLQSLERRDREEVQNVLEKINRGQALDLTRFGDAHNVQALHTAADLDEYTYLVAGCVGEFWTRVCFMHVNFSKRPADEMIRLGVQYGRGLQLINILRDIGTDVRAGRCYLPLDELQSLGVRPGNILRDGSGAGPVLAKWRQKARDGIAAGLEYACEIRNARVRFATALPALIGTRTLTLLDKAGA